jgi:hypothetical protein
MLPFLLALAAGEFRVVSPSELAKLLPDGVGYSVANFGHIPYGRKMVGSLILADPIENCEVENLNVSPS